MSSRAVRNQFRTWCGTLSVPFYDTVNLAQAPAEPIWCTARFDPSTNTVSTYCRTQEEEGQIELVYSAQPGTGDDSVLAAAEADIATLLGKADPTGRFVLTGNDAPEDASFGDADATFRITVIYTYVFFH